MWSTWAASSLHLLLFLLGSFDGGQPGKENGQLRSEHCMFSALLKDEPRLLPISRGRYFPKHGESSYAFCFIPIGACIQTLSMLLELRQKLIAGLFVYFCEITLNGRFGSIESMQLEGKELSKDAGMGLGWCLLN